MQWSAALCCPREGLPRGEEGKGHQVVHHTIALVLYTNPQVNLMPSDKPEDTYAGVAAMVMYISRLVYNFKGVLIVPGRREA